MSGKRIAWPGGSGPNASEGRYEFARLYWCEGTKPLGACKVVEGPILPITSAGGVLSVAEIWLAVTGCGDETCDAFVADPMSSVAYRIEPLAEGHGIEALGISANELFVADFRPNIGVAPILTACCVSTCRSYRSSR